MKILESFTRTKYIGRLCFSRRGASPIGYSKESKRNLVAVLEFRSKFGAPSYVASFGEVPE